MGFERICAVMQNVHSNYETDIFMPLITAIKKVCSSVYIDYSLIFDVSILFLLRLAQCKQHRFRVFAIVQSGYQFKLPILCLFILRSFFFCWCQVVQLKFSERVNHCVDGTRNSKKIEAYRVIADHLRACCIAIADGVIPAGTGRGYIFLQISF